MTLTARLPGVYFETAPPVDDETLPRMDIALFVGFAQRGDFNTPFAVEDAASFAREFGEDVELCWDETRGEIVYGYLGAAVRAFFRNGGRRCWVVRVPHQSPDNAASLLTFHAKLFLDARFANIPTVAELQTLVDYYRSQQIGRAGFKGIYAVLDPGDNCNMDEVTIIAVPDAIHLGWRDLPEAEIEPPLPSAPLDHPGWWHFAGCIPLASGQSPKGAVLEAPNLNPATNVQPRTLALTWTWYVEEILDTLPEYVLEQARRGDWSDAEIIYRGNTPAYTVSNTDAGDYLYRVRVEYGLETSHWSNAVLGQLPGDHMRPDAAEFQSRNMLVLAAPEMSPIWVDEHRELLVSWKWESDIPDRPIFILEEARLNDWRDAAEIYRGSATLFRVYGREPGEYYYRVRVSMHGETSNWSNGVGKQVKAAARLVQDEPSQVDSLLSLHQVLRLHKQLVQLCAARGDCFAVMALPRFVRAPDATRYIDTLRGRVEEKSRAFGALFHPWVYGRDELQPQIIRAIPPDGALCGVIASRAARDGAWVAPANEPLQNVFALDPHFRDCDIFETQQHGVNLIQQGPRGFVTLWAETLSTESEWRDINVRRLISLLRRLALKHGVRYVFEPNSGTFRRAIQHGFENLLRQMFLRGAFAGRTTNEAYQVVADERVNSAQRLDAGQLVVEIRVAPSLPLKFVSVVFLQTHDRTLVQEAV